MRTDGPHTRSMEHISRAKVWLVANQPFFSRAVLDIDYVPEADGVNTLSTDGSCIYFNPDFAAGLTVPELAGGICHEIMHNLLFHLPRRKGRVAQLWNLAADIAVNNDLSAAGIKLPPGSITHRAYSGMSAEEIYSALVGEYDALRQESGQGQNHQAPGDLSGILKRHGASGQELAESHSRWESAPEESHGPVEARDGWMEKLFEGMSAAESRGARGTVPGGCRRMASSLLAPKISWKDVLAETMAEYLKMEEYEPSRPNLKYISGSLHLPSMKADRPSLVVAAVDTSASIAKESLDLFMAEVFGLLEEAEEVEFLAFDARVHRLGRFPGGQGQDEVFEGLELKGGGGTDFAPIFRFIDEEGLDPAVAVVFTDLEGGFPEDPPSCPTIWVVPGGGREAPPFGEVIGISEANGH